MTQGLLCSQIGYSRSQAARVLWRADEPAPPPELRADGAVLAWHPLPACWQSHWWEAHVPAPEGKSKIILEAGPCQETISFGDNLLWEKTWREVSYESLSRRSHIAKNRRGWLDCGSHWQEANSHACCLLGLIDLLEFASHKMAATERERLQEQIAVGIDLLGWYQDLASAMPGGDGALIHEMPEHKEVIVPADVSKAAAVFARAARYVDDSELAKNCRKRAQRACAWLATAEPSGPIGFCAETHGVPLDTEVPKDFMTRDLLMELVAVIELAKADHAPLPERGVHLAERVLARQFDAPPTDCTLGGQFATFDGWPRPELAWTHYLGRGRIGNDVGATVPHWLIPFLRIAEWWPEHSLVPRLRACVKRFAYEYFLPACQANPCGILPIGEFPGQGLIWFAGLWHGMNSNYGYAAALAWEFQRFFSDDAFAPLIEGNLQWVVGLNGGLYPPSLIGCEMSTPDVIEGRYLPISMIYGIGRRYVGAWKTIKGSMGSGFCTGRSFHFDVPPEHEHDAPSSYADEDWITFNGAWLSAIARLQTPDRA